MNFLLWNKDKNKKYVYKGIKNYRKTKYKKFIKMCRMTQNDMKKYLTDVLKSAGYDPIVDDGYIFAKGTNTPVLLTAHMDTVHKEVVKDYYEDVREGGTHVLSSPQGIGGDDRCGIYTIYKIITKTDLRPTILFCEDEEVGGIGSDKFCTSKLSMELDELKFLIEIDRANANDAVFYDCDNAEFTDFILKETGFKESWGSFSDISNLSPECGVASVNLSCGYYNAHNLDEYVVMEEMENTIEIIKRLLEKAQQEDVPQYKYIERKYNYKKWWRDDYDYAWNYNIGETKTYIVVYTSEGYEFECETYGSTEEEAMYQFFIEHPDVCFNDILSHYEEKYVTYGY